MFLFFILSDLDAAYVLIPCPAAWCWPISKRTRLSETNDDGPLGHCEHERAAISKVVNYWERGCTELTTKLNVSTATPRRRFKKPRNDCVLGKKFVGSRYCVNFSNWLKPITSSFSKTIFDCDGLRCCNRQTAGHRCGVFLVVVFCFINFFVFVVLQSVAEIEKHFLRGYYRHEHYAIKFRCVCLHETHCRCKKIVTKWKDPRRN